MNYGKIYKHIGEVGQCKRLIGGVRTDRKISMMNHLDISVVNNTSGVILQVNSFSLQYDNSVIFTYFMVNSLVAKLYFL